VGVYIKTSYRSVNTLTNTVAFDFSKKILLMYII